MRRTSHWPIAAAPVLAALFASAAASGASNWAITQRNKPSLAEEEVRQLNLTTRYMTGTFDTSFGVLNMTPAGGTYATANGRLTVSRIEDRLIAYGTWEQSSARRMCPDGHYRGTFTFQWESADRFIGQYKYCDDNNYAGWWNGTRRK